MSLANAPLPVIFPAHPRTLSRIAKQGLEDLLEPLFLVKPLGFLVMLLLERRASLVVTDSGGVQKEAYLRDLCHCKGETEWVELLKSGWNLLADPSDSSAVLSAIQTQLEISADFPRPLLYGDGYASDQIVSVLQHF